MKARMPDREYLLSQWFEGPWMVETYLMRRETFRSTCRCGNITVYLNYFYNPFIYEYEVVSFVCEVNWMERLDLRTKDELEDFLLKHNKTPYRNW